MATPKKGRGLGAGLGSLLGVEETELKSLAENPSADVTQPAEPETPSAAGSSTAVDAAAVNLRLIDVCPNPDQPRKEFDEESLAELAESIRRNGVLQPILVRPAAHGKYIIIAGERRWRASRLAEKDTIPAVISAADEALAAELALIENLQREDLNPVEEAEGFRALGETYGLKQEEIAVPQLQMRCAC